METRTPNTLPFHRLAVFPVLLAQFVILLIAALALWYWHGVVAGYSGLCGGLIALLPNMYFAHRAFRFSGARAAQAIVRSFYAGEAGKLILTAVLFALTFAGVQPIVVRPIGGGRFEIIAGERRWRASQQAGQETIPAMVRDVPDETAIAMALIENIQREDLNPIEEAIALQRLQQEFKLTQQEVADAVGKSRVTVSNLLRLIALPEVIKTMLSHGDLEMGHARALLGLPENQQVEGARHVVARGLTVRQTEALVRQWLSGKPAPVETVKTDPDIARLEQRLAERLGSAVQIRHGKKGKGQLVIGYNSLDELQGVLSHIR